MLHIMNGLLNCEQSIFVPVFLVATFSCPGIRILGPILFGETVW